MSSPLLIRVERVGSKLFSAEVQDPGSHYGRLLEDVSATAATAQEAVSVLGLAIGMADQILDEKVARGGR